MRIIDAFPFLPTPNAVSAHLTARAVEGVDVLLYMAMGEKEFAAISLVDFLRFQYIVSVRSQRNAGAVFGRSSFVSLNASAQSGWRSCPTSSDHALYYSHYRDCGNQVEGVRPWHTYSLAGMHR